MSQTSGWVFTRIVSMDHYHPPVKGKLFLCLHVEGCGNRLGHFQLYTVSRWDSNPVRHIPRLLVQHPCLWLAELVTEPSEAFWKISSQGTLPPPPAAPHDTHALQEFLEMDLEGLALRRTKHAYNMCTLNNSFSFAVPQKLCCFEQWHIPNYEDEVTHDFFGFISFCTTQNQTGSWELLISMIRRASIYVTHAGIS